MKCASITTGQVVLPSFGLARTCPDIPTELYRTRLARTVERLRAERQDALVVYADREHCANVAYLTGFDPRFEEALLLLSSEGRRKLLVGNECLGDARLRTQLAQGLPDLWKRMQARRAFMRDVLGINLDDSVLPLSNTAGWLPPWALDLETALIVN